jgi:hypothetical protein
MDSNHSNNPNSPYQTNSEGKPTGYFGFFEIGEPGWVYFGTGYEPTTMDDGEPEAVNEELENLLRPAFPRVEIAMSESSHGIPAAEDEKETIVEKIIAILTGAGWLPFTA